MPLAYADTVAATPVDDLEDAELQQLEAQTSQPVEDIQGSQLIEENAFGMMRPLTLAVCETFIPYSHAGLRGYLTSLP